MRAWFGTLFIALGCLATPLGVQAHPHVYVTTRIVLEIDPEQRVTGVTMTWEYDDFFSLLIFEDMGLDDDADGTLTEAELDKLMGFDLVEWPEGFEGDLYLYSGNEKIDMPRPRPHDIAVRDGKIISTQKRDIPNVPAEGLRIFQYDPTFYVAYSLRGGIELPGPCTARILPPDLEEAEKEVKRLTEANTGEDLFMAVELGHLYAEEVSLTCG